MNTYTVYDVTRRETFTNLSDIWAKEIDLYSTNQDCIKMLVGNKVDRVCLLPFTFKSVPLYGEAGRILLIFLLLLGIIYLCGQFVVVSLG